MSRIKRSSKSQVARVVSARRVLRFSPGFTLIEILVVIGIVSVLSALMFPVIARAREAGLRTTSLSNLHELGLATVAYAGDNDDTLPPYRNWELWLLQNDPLVTTTGVPTDSQDPPRLVAALSAYLGYSRDVWFCPADRYRVTHEAFGFFNHTYTSYLFIGWPGGDPKAINTYPLVVNMTNLRPNGVLFGEPLGVVGKDVGGYWQEPIRYGVFADGSAKAFHFRVTVIPSGD